MSIFNTKMAAFKSRLQLYYRLTKPGIVYGNSLMVAGGFLFAAHGHRQFGLLLLTVLAIACIMAAGCVFNNVLDRAIDARMQRTKQRALVKGEVTKRSALIFAICLAFLGLGLLAVYVNTLTALLGFIALFAYVVLYGIAKRKTVWGTLVGCLSGSLPPVGGYTAVTNQLDRNTLFIFLIMVAWQLAHFYAIAMYRLKDYQAAGIPVWPARRGLASTRRQILLYICVFAVACIGLVLSGTAGISFAVVMIVAALGWLTRATLWRRKSDNDGWARGVFGDSLMVMLVLSVMLALGSTLA